MRPVERGLHGILDAVDQVVPVGVDPPAGLDVGPRHDMAVGIDGDDDGHEARAWVSGALDGRHAEVWGLVLVVIGLIAALGIAADLTGPVGRLLRDLIGAVVGILTTNDFFYLILNPVLGIGESGSRVIVRHCENTDTIAAALQCVGDMNFELTNAAYLPSRRGDENDLLLHISEDDSSGLVACMKDKGLDAEARER